MNVTALNQNGKVVCQGSSKFVALKLRTLPVGGMYTIITDDHSHDYVAKPHFSSAEYTRTRGWKKSFTHLQDSWHGSAYQELCI